MTVQFVISVCEFHVTTDVTNKYIFVVLKALPGTTLPCNWTVLLPFIYLSINFFVSSPFDVFPNGR
jgi:hypothetical protein